MNNDGCKICGDCWWVDCANAADYEVDIDLKRNGMHVYGGPVDLCAGHAKYAMSTGSLSLDWTALEQALERRKQRVS